MASTEALAVAGRLKAALLAAGVPQVSIELQRGRSGRWVSSGHHGGVSFVANLGHHIASRPSSRNPTPGLAVVKYGRRGLPAPLCNGYGGMDLVARIICLDWANHPGQGGPWTVDGYRIPRDSGRPYLFGWEHEGGYSAAVWDATYTNRATGKRMTYRQFMGACHAGTLMFLNRPRTSHGEHRTWADFKSRGRKIDRLGYNRQRGIIELTPFYGSKAQLPNTGQPVEDDMTPEQAKMLDQIHMRVFRAGYLDSKISNVDKQTLGAEYGDYIASPDGTHKPLTVAGAIFSARRDAWHARLDAAVARRLTEQLVQGVVLTDEAVRRVAEEVADELTEPLDTEG